MKQKESRPGSFWLKKVVFFFFDFSSWPKSGNASYVGSGGKTQHHVEIRSRMLVLKNV